MSTIPRDIALKAAVGRVIDGEAWKAMEDGRASLEGSLWHLRLGWALEKAEQIINAVKADLRTNTTLDHWRQEVGKLHSQIDVRDDEIKRLRKALLAVETWAQQKCPCHEETPNPCPLCGASVENLESCKAAESIFPRSLLNDIRDALSSTGAKGRPTLPTE